MILERDITKLPKIVWESAREIVDERKALLITSPTALAKSKDFLKGINATTTVFIAGTDRSYAEKLAQSDYPEDVCYLLGGGQVFDIGRYLAQYWQKETIGIPTIISTDSPFVETTGLRENGCVTYVKSKTVDKLILDQELLSHADARFHLSGCGDVLSIFTSLWDWEYANSQNKARQSEAYNSGIAAMANGILNGLIAAQPEIQSCSEAGIAAIVNSLAMEVMLCNLYGNSRPEEGGEHIFAYAAENKLDSFLHGEMVSFAVLLTGHLQGQDISQIKEFMDEIGLSYKPEGLSRELVVEILKELPQFVRKHNLPYGIYSNLDYAKEAQNVEDFLNSVNL